jgi:hypothetical protein
VLLLTLVVSSVVGEQAAHAERVAVMPLGSAVLLPSVRDSLDGDLRAAVGALDGIQVQAATETQAHIQEAADNGLDLTTCPASRDDCALRVGLLADVDSVVTFAVEEAGDRLVLRGSFLAVDGSKKRRIAGELIAPQRDNGVSLKSFVARLLTGTGAVQNLPFRLSVEPAGSDVRVDGAAAALSHGGLLWLAPGDHALHIEAPGRAPIERTIAVHPDGDDNELVLALSEADTPVPFYVGVATAGVGGLLALGAGAVAVFTEVQLEQGQVTFTQRQFALNGGKTSVFVAAGGVALLGAGVVAAMWPEP